MEAQQGHVFGASVVLHQYWQAQVSPEPSLH